MISDYLDFLIYVDKNFSSHMIKEGIWKSKREKDFAREFSSHDVVLDYIANK